MSMCGAAYGIWFTSSYRSNSKTLESRLSLSGLYAHVVVDSILYTVYAVLNACAYYIYKVVLRSYSTSLYRLQTRHRPLESTDPRYCSSRPDARRRSYRTVYTCVQVQSAMWSARVLYHGLCIGVGNMAFGVQVVRRLCPPQGVEVTLKHRPRVIQAIVSERATHGCKGREFDLVQSAVRLRKHYCHKCALPPRSIGAVGSG